MGNVSCMTRKILLGLVAILTAFSAASAEIPSDCSNGTSVSVQDVADAYSKCSVELVDLAQRGDLAGLTSRVAPSARFTVWEGDAELGRKVGPAGAIEFTQRVGAATFRYAIPFVGPLSTDICGIQIVTVWLTRPDARQAYIADFKYSQGVLVEAKARMAQVSEGAIRQSAKP
jgi:hypothetical protein